MEERPDILVIIIHSMIIFQFIAICVFLSPPKEKYLLQFVLC